MAEYGQKGTDWNREAWHAAYLSLSRCKLFNLFLPQFPYSGNKKSTACVFVVKNKWINTCKCLEQRAWQIVTLYRGIIHIILQALVPRHTFSLLTFRGKLTSEKMLIINFCDLLPLSL